MFFFAETCSENQIDEAHYETRHSNMCNLSNHWHIEPAYNRIFSMLQSGGVPLIQISDPCANRVCPQLDVLKAEAGLPYVAISHVWSDGLGNLKDNSLP